MSVIAKFEPECLNQSANTRSPGMVRNLNGLAWVACLGDLCRNTSAQARFVRHAPASCLQKPRESARYTFLRRMRVIRISNSRGHQTQSDPDIVPLLKSFWHRS